jgi:hypothetical protein
MDRFAPSPASQLQIDFRHSHWAAARERTRRCLVDARLPIGRRYGFQMCGNNAMVWIDRANGRVKQTCWCCHDRWCEACGRTRRQRLAKALTAALPGHRACHVVLTPQSNDHPLRTQIKTLFKNFATLRRRKWWQARAAGGAWVFELTWNPDTKQWHPHLHCIVHTSWMQLQELSAEWKRVTKNSHRVHISLVKQHAPLIRELTKYVGKIRHRSWEHSSSLLLCAIKALSGVRLAGTFGTWRGVQLDAPADPDPAAVWELWGTLDQLLSLAKSRDPAALQILAQLRGAAPPATSPATCARPPPTPQLVESL